LENLDQAATFIWIFAATLALWFKLGASLTASEMIL